MVYYTIKSKDKPKVKIRCITEHQDLKKNRTMIILDFRCNEVSFAGQFDKKELLEKLNKDIVHEKN